MSGKIAKARYRFNERQSEVSGRTSTRVMVPRDDGGSTSIKFRAVGQGEYSQWVPIHHEKTAEYLENADRVEVKRQ